MGIRFLTDNFVNAAGPFSAEIGSMLGLDLPIENHLHLKVAYRDSLRIDAPRCTPSNLE